MILNIQFNIYAFWLLAMFILPVTSFASASQPAPSGDPVMGRSVYDRCMGCHSLQGHRTGPKHCGLFGRKAGSAKGFDYSDAMRKSDIVWNLKTLDAFLSSPFKIIPGTSMGYGGVWNEKDRANLIAYLQLASSSAECN